MQSIHRGVRLTSRFKRSPSGLEIHMRYLMTGAAVLTLFVCACSKRSESTKAPGDDVKKDLALTTSTSNALATPPMNYKPMRFVSDIERSRATVKAERPKVSKHPDRMAPSRGDGVETSNAALEEVVSMAAEAPSPVATAEVTVPRPDEPMIGDGQPMPGSPMGRPASTPAGGPSAGHEGGGWGGFLGGLMGNVVIRGGRGDDDKCDPRTPRGRRGAFVMPSPVGGGGFTRHVYR
jgi:hypothetical protein